MTKEKVRKALAPRHTESVYGIGADPGLLVVTEGFEQGGAPEMVPAASRIGKACRTVRVC